MVALAIFGVLGFAGYENTKSKVNIWDVKYCLKLAWLEKRAVAFRYSPERVNSVASGCPEAYVTWDELQRFSEARPSFLLQMVLEILESAFAGAAGGLAVFAFWWAAGWAISGFLRG